ncbi:hypothetical protein RUND412_003083 [Rhizina undulata]
MKFFAAFSAIAVTGVIATNNAIMPQAIQSSRQSQSLGGSKSATEGLPRSQPASKAAALVQTSAAMMASEVTPMATTQAPAYTATMMAPVSNAGPQTYTVTVGGSAGLVYTPSYISAAVNDSVQFVFMSQNHTATQSSFDKPCNKLSADAADSGFHPNPNNTVVPAPTFEFIVSSTDPTWFYCRQTHHCGMGMVFAINPTVTNSFDAFKAAAIALNGTTASAAAANTVAAVESTVTLIANGGTSTDLVAPPAATMNSGLMTSGWNTGEGSSCSCACFCGVGSFPVGDGVGSYGGFGGSLPAPW